MELCDRHIHEVSRKYGVLSVDEKADFLEQINAEATIVKQMRRSLNYDWDLKMDVSHSYHCFSFEEKAAFLKKIGAQLKTPTVTPLFGQVRTEGEFTNMIACNGLAVCNMTSHDVIMDHLPVVTRVFHHNMGAFGNACDPGDRLTAPARLNEPFLKRVLQANTIGHLLDASYTYVFLFHVDQAHELFDKSVTASLAPLSDVPDDPTNRVVIFLSNPFPILTKQTISSLYTFNHAVLNESHIMQTVHGLTNSSHFHCVFATAGRHRSGDDWTAIFPMLFGVSKRINLNI